MLCYFIFLPKMVAVRHSLCHFSVSSLIVAACATTVLSGGPKFMMLHHCIGDSCEHDAYNHHIYIASSLTVDGGPMCHDGSEWRTLLHDTPQLDGGVVGARDDLVTVRVRLLTPTGLRVRG
jgi:hypothetical protein